MRLLKRESRALAEAIIKLYQGPGKSGRPVEKCHAIRVLAEKSGQVLTENGAQYTV